MRFSGHVIVALLAFAPGALGWREHCEPSDLSTVEDCCFVTDNSTGRERVSFESETLNAEAEALCDGAFGLDVLVKMRRVLDGDARSHEARMDLMWDHKLWSELTGTWIPESDLDHKLEAVHRWREAQGEWPFSVPSRPARVEVAFLEAAVEATERDLAARAANGTRVFVFELDHGRGMDELAELFAGHSSRVVSGSAYCAVEGEPKVQVVLVEDAAGLDSTPRGAALTVDGTCPIDRRALLVDAAAAGRAALVAALLERTPAPDLDAAALAAVAHGHAEVAPPAYFFFLFRASRPRVDP